MISRSLWAVRRYTLALSRLQSIFPESKMIAYSGRAKFAVLFARRGARTHNPVFQIDP